MALFAAGKFMLNVAPCNVMSGCTFKCWFSILLFVSSYSLLVLSYITGQVTEEHPTAETPKLTKLPIRVIDEGQWSVTGHVMQGVLADCHVLSMSFSITNDSQADCLTS